MKQVPENILISRTDSIGDVVLTLPLAKILKEQFPGVTIAFMGKGYTKAIIECCSYVDEFVDVKNFMSAPISIKGVRPQSIIHVFPEPTIAKRAKALKIPIRIGTTNRLYHWNTCNELVRLSRKNSTLHEAQLNLKLLEPFGISRDFTMEDISASFGLTKLKPLPSSITELVEPGKFNLILHAKSQGSAREWGLENFNTPISLLDVSKYKIFISGTDVERPSLIPLFEQSGARVTDITGKMTLAEFISFINLCDGLVANSTGPLHIAAALGKDAFGIYPPLRPIHPGRWAPVGPRSHVFTLKKFCNDCRKKALSCHCITEVDPHWITKALEVASSNHKHE